MGRRDKPVKSAMEELVNIGAKMKIVRQTRGISLTVLANKLGYTKGYLSGVENGNTRPSDKLVQGYERELGLVSGELNEFGLTVSPGEAARARPWCVPYHRNRFFTGRLDVLKDIDSKLKHGDMMPQVLAITGLGGVGKSQLALEYAYLHQKDYQAVLWVQSEISETLKSSFMRLADCLGLSDGESQDQASIVSDVQQWLKKNSDCLIILDNVEDPKTLYPLLSELGNNFVLVTTRAQVVGTIAPTLELKEMSIEEAQELLLRRAKISETSKISVQIARSIAEILGCLPLALNQAGSYIEGTGCGLVGYLQLIQTQHSLILKERDQFSEYPASVVTTWSVSFEKIQESHNSYAELLYLCAFLQPDVIYTEFLVNGAKSLGETLASLLTIQEKLWQAIGELRRYSLIHTDQTTGIISIHRLVQMVIRDSLDPERRLEWIKRVIGANYLAFPALDVNNISQVWSKCQRYFPQANACMILMREWNMLSSEGAELLSNIGKYKEERNELDGAEDIYRYALRMNIQLFGESSEKVAWVSIAIARVAEKRGRDKDAEDFYEKALFIQSSISHPEALALALLRSYVPFLRKRGGKDSRREITRLDQQIKKLSGRDIKRQLKREIINDDDQRIVYHEKEKNWQDKELPGRDDYNNDAHITSVKGASFEFLFEGIGVELIADPAYADGKIKVIVDNEYIEEIDMSYINNRFTQSIIFSKIDLLLGEHVLLVKLEEGTMMVDAIAYYTYIDLDNHTEE